MKLLIAIVLLFSSCILFSCKDNPSYPVDNTPPGKRDYVWSVDSIDYASVPGVIGLNSIWGSSPTDVWGAGYTGLSKNCLWHYDGTKWSRVVWNYDNGPKILGGVWGTAQNDVWTFGTRITGNPDASEPFVMHFGGYHWSELNNNTDQMPDGFTDIYPIRKDHFWVSSYHEVSEYKDGVWKKYFIGQNYQIQSVGGNGINVYLTVYPYGPDSLYLMQLIDDNFRIVDKTTLLSAEGDFGYSGLLFANNKIYTFQRSVFSKFDGNLFMKDWTKELTLDNGGFYNSFAGSNKDIWAIGINTLPYHFNGENWSPIFIGELHQESHFTGIWGDGEEIFMCDKQNGIVYHGR